MATEKCIQLRVGSYISNFLYSTPPTAARSKHLTPVVDLLYYTSVKQITEICYYYFIIIYTYAGALEKLSLHSLRKQRHDFEALFVCSALSWALNFALPFWKMLAFVFLPAILETSHCLVLVPLINTVLLLVTPMLPTWWERSRHICNLSRFSQSYSYSSTSNCYLIIMILFCVM
jgi:hypothetical protein